MIKLKPTAYMYPQYSGNGPDNYSEDEAGLVLAKNLNDLAEWEKKASAPLYVVPDGYALAPVDALEAARDNAQELLTWHLEALGETTTKNASQAQQYRDELAKLNQLIDKAGVVGL